MENSLAREEEEISRYLALSLPNPFKMRPPHDVGTLGTQLSSCIILFLILIQKQLQTCLHYSESITFAFIFFQTSSKRSIFRRRRRRRRPPRPSRRRRLLRRRRRRPQARRSRWRGSLPTRGRSGGTASTSPTCRKWRFVILVTRSSR